MDPITHIHNGDAVALRAKRAGIGGEHLPFRESLISGPVREGDGWIDRRAKFLSGMSGDDVLRTSNKLFEQEQAITNAAANAEEIVLWFEYDMFCLIHLVYLLPRLPAGRTSVIWHDSPLAELPPEDLFAVHARRRPATREMIGLAREGWQAFVSEDPTALNKMVSAHFNEFPFLRDGFALHAARFPSTRNGLGLAEQRILEFIADGATDSQALYNRFWSSYPRFGFGDTEILRNIHSLAARRLPLINLTEGSEGKSSFTITEQGELTLAGADDIAVNGIDTWLGGAHLTSDRLWRWDADKALIV
jgi:hypothetical protein